MNHQLVKDEYTLRSMVLYIVGYHVKVQEMHLTYYYSHDVTIARYHIFRVDGWQAGWRRGCRHGCLPLSPSRWRDTKTMVTMSRWMILVA